MAFPVELSAQATQNIEEHYGWIQDITVYILAVRHTAKKLLEKDDLEEVLEN